MSARALGRIVLYTAIVMAGATDTARASCGISDVPAAVAAAVSGRLSSPSRQAPAGAQANAFAVDPSIVGLWRTTFAVDVDGTQVPLQRIAVGDQ